MSHQKPTRLAKAATYFNTGKDEIFNFLIEKGFNIENNPNARIDDAMYSCLDIEFGKEHDTKEEVNIALAKSKEIILPQIKEQVNKEIEKEVEKEVENVQIEIDKKIDKEILSKIDTEENNISENIDINSVEDNNIEELEVIDSKPKLKILGKIDVSDHKDSRNKSKKQTVKEKPISKKEDKKNVEIVEEIDNTNVIVKVESILEENIIDTKNISEKENNSNSDLKIVEKQDNKQKEEEVVEHINTNFQKLEGTKVLGTIDLSTIKSDNRGSINKDKNKKRVRIKETKPNVEKTTVKFEKPASEFKKEVKPKKTIKTQNDKDAIKVVSQSEIEESIKRTQARLNINNSNLQKGQRQKIRKKKREEINEKLKLNEIEENDKLLKITEFITVSDLASLMHLSPTQIISLCFNLGVVVSINQRLDAEIIELITSEFDYEVEFISLEDSNSFEEEIDKPEDLLSRAPIVTIMGHVDHGKTSLLDFIRNANVVNKEAGGITQHIGAYDVVVPKHNRKVTFIDTPGHEAFTAMRARGAKLTDIAVIVIAADDKVMPQTREAISHAQSASVPMIFALNKIDKDGANPDGVRSQLSEMNILVESWGGKHQEQEISAKKGTGIDDLLEKILLESDMLDLKANHFKKATGTVIEASLDKGRGYVATVLVLGGKLKVGDFIVAGGCYGKIKAMSDHLGNKLKEVIPGEPVQILGLNGAPSAGETFKEFDNEQEAKQIAQKRSQIERELGIRTKKHITLDEIGRRLALGTFKELNLIIKGDVDGSVQALADSLIKLSTNEIHVNILYSAVGQISESDVLLASASDAIIIGFQVRPSSQAKLLADKESIDIRHYSVIYQAIDEIKSAIEGMLEPTIEEKINGTVEVREVYNIPKVGTIAGCFVSEGKVYKNSKVRIIRDGIVVHTSELSSLKRFKDDVKEVVHGQDCGLSIKNFNDIKVGDNLEIFEEIEIKRTL